MLLLLVGCAQQPKHDTPLPIAPPATPVENKPEPPPPAPPVHKKPKPKPPVAKTVEIEKETPGEGVDATQVGYYIDVLQGRLRQLADAGMAINRHGETLTVDLSSHFHFADEDAQLSPADCDSLTPLAKVLVEYRMTRVMIQLHAEDSSEAATKIAKARVLAIVKCLGAAGIAAKRIDARDAPGTAQLHGSTIMELQVMVRAD